MNVEGDEKRNNEKDGHSCCSDAQQHDERLADGNIDVLPAAIEPFAQHKPRLSYNADDAEADACRVDLVHVARVRNQSYRDATNRNCKAHAIVIDTRDIAATNQARLA